MKTNVLFIALLTYSVFSLTTLFSWQTKGINTVTGDEPHYLVIASGIVNHGSLEQSAPYKEEFQSRKIYTPGLAPHDANPTPENTHAVLGPNGLFNVHNIGLPLLLAVPYLFGGITGAKLTMVFFGLLVVVVTWKFSSRFSENEIHRFWAVVATTISPPLIPASGQIYPDVIAGLIALIGVYWFSTTNERKHASAEALLAAIVVFLPWLQIKFAATCLILVVSIVIKIYLQTKDVRRITQILIIAGASCVALAAYNYYAFGKISGPYQSGALELSKTSLMTLIGLHLDQNQGFILQNPINLIGIVAIGWLYHFNRSLCFVWALVFLSLIVPNALHPNWYGGFSFSGRFQWAAAILFVIPTTYGLLTIAKNKQSLFRTIIISGLLLQLYFFYQYAINGVSLHNKGADAWFDSYPIFYYPIHDWLPMLYNSDWAYGYLPNYLWTLLTVALFVLGFLPLKTATKKTGWSIRLATSLIIVFVFLAGLEKNKQSHETTFQAAQLPSQTGSILNSYRVANAATDKPGFISFGPYFPLRQGSYQVTFSYRSPAPESEDVGWVDVFNADAGMHLKQIPLAGTSNIVKKLNVDFNVDQWGLNPFEFRTYWDGNSDLELREISLKTNY